MADVWLRAPHSDWAVVLLASRDAPDEVRYEVWRGDRQVIAASRLGLALDGRAYEHLRLVDEGSPQEVADHYRAVGHDAEMTAIAQERAATFENPNGDPLEVVFRIFDDAVGIRYLLGEGADDVISRDLTEFVFAQPGKAWIQPHDLPGLATPAYEAYYTDGVDIGHDAPVPSWNVPALFETGPTWVLISESGTGSGNYGAHLRVAGELTYRIELPQPGEGMSTQPAGEPVTLPWRSPWRVMILADDLAGIVESRAIAHFAEPSTIDNDSWIQAGRVSWSWWSDHASPRNPDALRVAVDLAHAYGWEYTLIDANWNQLAEGELESLVGYAADREVGVFLWYNSGGPNNVVPEEPRDLMHETTSRRAEMARLQDLGIRGIKVDFFHSDRTEMIDRYVAIADDAADHELLVNFHGATVPRGWERTFPNVMTMEAVAGAEQYGFAADYPEAAVWHNTILPFTRNVAGPMDYTPVALSHHAYSRLTSDAHELALAVVYTSPLQHFADSKASYDSLSEMRREFLRRVPAVWDESRLLEGYPGEYAVFARRRGQDWFVAGINGRTPRRIDLELDFLEASATLHLIGDGHVDEERSLREMVSIDMEAGGGFAGWVTSD